MIWIRMMTLIVIIVPVTIYGSWRNWGTIIFDRTGVLTMIVLMRVMMEGVVAVVVIGTMTFVDMIMLVFIKYDRLFIGQKVFKLMNEIVVWSDVQIDERFDFFIAVIVFRNLYGNQGIYGNQAQVYTSAPNGAVIRVDVGIGTVGINGISTASLLG